MVIRSSRSAYVAGDRCIGCYLLLVASLGSLFLTGCTGNKSGSTGAESTTVVLLASSTANDQLTEFPVTLTGLSLIDQTGKPVSLLSSRVSDDFVHVNGNVEPLATVMVPQGTYTSAQATAELAFPECAGQGSGQLLINDSLANSSVPSEVTINMPEPITVTATPMGLTLNLQVSASAPFSGGCSSSLTNSVQVAPVFNLTPVDIASQPTNLTNGRMSGLRGLVTSVDSGGTNLNVKNFNSPNADYPASWQVQLNESSIFQGISDASQIVAGMPVNIDLNILSDGSLLATRVEVPDSNTSNLSIAYGPPLALYAAGGYQAVYPVMDALQVGQGGNMAQNSALYSLGNASFQISGQSMNFGSLPFQPAFNATTIVDGQNILLTTHVPAGTNIPSVSSIMLLPQSIDGTVSAVSVSGSFTTYTITLATYNLFPNLAVQPGQTTLLTNPNTVIVYVDSNTQMLNGGSIAVGNTFRFYGLIFNDNGTLRMDCEQINAGVAE